MELMDTINAIFEIECANGNKTTINKKYKICRIDKNHITEPKYFEDHSITNEKIDIYLKEIKYLEKPLKSNNLDINLIIE